jgi:hypothetical protein
LKYSHEMLQIDEQSESKLGNMNEMEGYSKLSVKGSGPGKPRVRLDQPPTPSINQFARPSNFSGQPNKKFVRKSTVFDQSPKQARCIPRKFLNATRKRARGEESIFDYNQFNDR